MDGPEAETPVEVTVEVTVPEPEAETPETPAVVVVETPEPEAATEVVLETAIDHEGRLAVIESRIEALEMVAAQAASTAEAAITIATSEPVEPEPEPVIEDIAPEPVEPDIAPDNEHWFFKKSGKGWFGL